MTVSFTYVSVLLAFIVPPILILCRFARRRDRAWWGPRPLSGLGLLIALATVYTTPLTNSLIPAGVWWYGEGAVVATVWHTPVEEYLFFVLQPMLTAFWLFQDPPPVDRSLSIPLAHRFWGGAGGLTLAAAGWVLIGGTSTYYLGWLLAWAGPVLAVQWGFGITYLWDVRRSVLIAIGVPTLYLWVVDRIAIALGIWIISDAHTVGYTLVGLPVEEAMFFLVTNVFVVQGIVMYVWVLEHVHELPTASGVLSRLDARFDDQ